MAARHDLSRLSVDDIERILAVTAKLAAPFDLAAMLKEVAVAAIHVLRADRSSIWLFEPASDEMVLETGTHLGPIRVPADAGLVGACAQSRQAINVPDCYADPRFNRGIDRASGYVTRCMLALPLVDHEERLVGVMQVLNKRDGVFDAGDEALAGVLAAQCAVALQRARMTQALLEGEKLRQELEMARIVQMSTLPSAMPAVPGYDLHATFQPASLTGGDTYDLCRIDQGVLVVLGDATGHGIAPALSVTQMQAMLRMALAMGADLETAFVRVNNRLAETMAEDRFVTAFIGLLDPATHALRFHSGGQAPILHYHADTGRCTTHGPTSFPLAALPLATLPPAVTIDLAPGDIVALLSDGIYEYRGADGDDFGQERVEALLHAHADAPADALGARVLEAVAAFAGGAPQEDDITIVLVKRAAGERRSFARSFDALDAIFAFTADFARRHGVGPGCVPTIDFALEELFTNMVKYSLGGRQAIDVALVALPGGMEATLTDYDVDPFDPRQAPVPDVDLPIEQRRPGGLGVHLVRQMLDGIGYHYDPEARVSRITLRKTMD
ncbi:MAG: SpoIIE family protein phosphatase [Burkholderiales bacterium]